MVEAVPWHFAAFSKFSLETFVPNVVSLTCLSLQIPEKNLDGDISDFWVSGESLVNENFLNFRTSNDIDMKLGPLTKLDKRNTATSFFYKTFSYNKIIARKLIVVLN